MAAHRYWSFYITDTQDADVALIKAAIAEIELRTSVGGADQTGSGVAIQSVGVGANAFDDNNGTDWDSVFGNSLPQRVGYDFGAGNEVDIVEAAITASSGSPGVAPGAFSIDWSDDSSAWTVSNSFTGEINWTSNEQRVFAAVAAPSGQTILTIQHTPVAPSGKSVLQLRHLPQLISKSILTLQHTPVAPSGKSVLTLRHRLIATGQSVLTLRHQPNTAALGSEWALVVVLDGVDVSARVTGVTRVSATGGAARLANFVVKPLTGVIDAQEWVKKSVTIDYLTFTGGVQQTRHRRFTGLVNDATYDPQTRLTSFECTDDLQAGVEALDFSVIDSIIGGYYSSAIFNETDNGWEYAQQRLESQLASYDKDVFGAGRKWDWLAKATPDLALDESGIINDSLALTQATSRDIVNQVNISFKFRYPRKWQREMRLSWLFPDSWSDYLSRGPRLPNRDMFMNALGSSWWIKYVGFTKTPPAGQYDNRGWFVSEEVRNALIMGANAVVATRWVQDVVEEYSLKIKSDASIAEFGLVEKNETYAFDAPEEEPHGEISSGSGIVSGAVDPDSLTSVDYLPPEAGSVAVNDTDYYLDSAARADFDNAIQTAEAVGMVDVLVGLHSNELAFDIPVNPAIDVGSTVQVTVNVNDVDARGTVGELDEVYDLEAGSAIATVVVNLYAPNVASQVSDPIAVPARPDVTPFDASPSIPLGTYPGGEKWGVSQAVPTRLSRAIAPANPSWRGLLTNYDVQFDPLPDTVFYPFEFRIEMPETEPELRDEQTFVRAAEINVAIPQELLTINA